MTAPSALGAFVASRRTAGTLVVQPRMGFADPGRMRAGLRAVRAAHPTAAGTITLDSYTRLGQHDAVARAMREGVQLNGYPLLHHPPQVTREVIRQVAGPGFPVQVRHGSPMPADIFAALAEAGLSASEGGPASYCLPYSRTPLAVSVRDWERGCALLAGLRDRGVEPHLETFGGCMLGQLCPPSMLIAVSVLEAMFFVRNGIGCVSLSYAHQGYSEQDREALWALRRLACRFLVGADWHVVLYTYMGLFPRTPGGAAELARHAVRLAVTTGTERLIVKTVAEAERIPTIEESVSAVREAARYAGELAGEHGMSETVQDTGVLAEAEALIEATLCLDDDVGRALVAAFASGYLDVPYCLHPDNAGKATSRLDGNGGVVWADTGKLPIPSAVRRTGAGVGSAELLRALGEVRDHFDAAASLPGPHNSPTSGLGR
ncbi:methylaspartate mutase [Streptomyces sp. YIM 103828]|uniref:methylaspartate mutase n=1 Tax=Streptomyces sp. YIM 103828 TaxID=3158968 RepID=UPI0032D8BE3B